MCSVLPYFFLVFLLVLLIVGREMLPSVDCLLPWELLRFWIMLYCVLDILNIVLWDSGSLGSIKTLWRKSTVNLVHFSLDSMSQSIFCRLWIWCQLSFQGLSRVPSPGRCRRSAEQVLLELHQGASVGASSKPLLFCPGFMHEPRTLCIGWGLGGGPLSFLQLPNPPSSKIPFIKISWLQSWDFFFPALLHISLSQICLRREIAREKWHGFSLYYSEHINLISKFLQSKRFFS